MKPFKKMHVETSRFKSSYLEQHTLERRKKNLKKEGKLAAYLFLHINPFNVNMEFCHSHSQDHAT
jgi:hypothetical protein